MQASLAVIGCLAGLSAWWQTGNWAWLLGAVVLIANWPYTLLGIMPTNQKLMATEPASAGPESRALIEKWGGLHAVRTGLGLAATSIFLWASMSWCLKRSSPIAVVIGRFRKYPAKPLAEKSRVFKHLPSHATVEKTAAFR
jgi:hypothetical protein